MKLIADSGSTKTHWYLIENQKHTIYTTQGYNPYYCTTEEVRKSLKEELLVDLDSSTIKELYFYGAGCSNDLTQAVISNALEPVFSNATLSMGDDLLAAARATAAHEAGICCILGTGCNSCYYDGTSIKDKIPSLGYVLGDEGSGTHIAKALMRAYYYRDLPKALKVDLETSYNMDKHVIISRLLEDKHPNRYLASFSMFCSKHKNHSFVQKLVGDCFEEFLNCRVLKYSEASKLPVHFVGSIAFGFQDLLIERLNKLNLKPGKIFQSPFPALLEYSSIKDLSQIKE